MTFYTKDQVLDLFRGFEIIRFVEVGEFSKVLKGQEHYYEVFAKKIK